jgi:hypothetical protein
LLNAIQFFIPCYLVTDTMLFILPIVDMASIIFVSGAAMILAALAIEAGLPIGVLNIVHGTHVSFCF